MCVGWGLQPQGCCRTQSEMFLGDPLGSSLALHCPFPLHPGALSESPTSSAPQGAAIKGELSPSRHGGGGEGISCQGSPGLGTSMGSQGAGPACPAPWGSRGSLGSPPLSCQGRQLFGMLAVPRPWVGEHSVGTAPVLPEKVREQHKCQTRKVRGKKTQKNLKKKKKKT